jgi:hypothetical protein
MKDVFRFEFKQLPFSLLVLTASVLFILICVPVQHDFTTYKDQSTSTSQSIHNMVSRLAMPIKDYSQQPTDQSTPLLPEEQRAISEANYKAIRNALQQRNFRQVNKRVLAQWREAPQDTYRSLLLPLGYWFSGGKVTAGVDLEAPYSYLVAHRLNVTPMVSGRSDAVNVIGNALGAAVPMDDIDGNGKLILYALIGILCVLFGFMATQNFQNKTDGFVHTLPVSMFHYQISRTFLTIAAFNVAVIVAIGLNIMIVSVMSDHDFGSFLYPLVYVHKGDTALVILWQFFAIWLLLLNLWACFISSMSLLISHWIRNPIANIFCLAAVAFAKPLNLLAMLPQKVQLYIPLNYNAIFDMVYRRGQFDTMPPRIWITVFIVWDILVWAVVALMIKIRERPLSVHRTNLANQNQ